MAAAVAVAGEVRGGDVAGEGERHDPRNICLSPPEAVAMAVVGR